MDGFLEGPLAAHAAFVGGAKEPTTAFSRLLPSMKAKLPDIRCLKTARRIGNDNCVTYFRKTLQIPPPRHRRHYVRAKVEVRQVSERRDGGLLRHPEAGALRPEGEVC